MSNKFTLTKVVVTYQIFLGYLFLNSDILYKKRFVDMAEFNKSELDQLKEYTGK